MKGIEYAFLSNPDITQKQVAEKLGATTKAVNHWVKGRSKVPKKYLDLLSEIFKLSPDIFNKDVEWKITEIIDYEESNGNIFEVYNERIVVLKYENVAKIFRIIKQTSDGKLYAIDNFNREYVLNVNEIYEMVETARHEFYRRLDDLTNKLREIAKKEINHPILKKNLVEFIDAIFTGRKELQQFYIDYHYIDDDLYSLICSHIDLLKNDVAALCYFIIEMWGHMGYGEEIKLVQRVEEEL